MADLIPRTEAYIAKMRNYLAFAADGTYPHVAPCKGRAFNKYAVIACILTIVPSLYLTAVLSIQPLETAKLKMRGFHSTA